MTSFFSARAYRFGGAAATLVGCYLVGVVLFLLLGAVEIVTDPTGREGGFGLFLGMLMTAPFSYAVVMQYVAIEDSRGVPQSDQDGGLWMIPTFLLCGLLNALLLWVVFRGRRVREHDVEPAVPAGH